MISKKGETKFPKVNGGTNIFWKKIVARTYPGGHCVYCLTYKQKLAMICRWVANIGTWKWKLNIDTISEPYQITPNLDVMNT